MSKTATKKNWELTREGTVFVPNTEGLDTKGHTPAPHQQNDDATRFLPDSVRKIPAPPALDDGTKFQKAPVAPTATVSPVTPLENRTLQTGDTLQNGKYVILSRKGQGSFGVTYEAIDTVLERSIIIKEHFPMSLAGRPSTDSTVHPRSQSIADTESYSWSLNRFYDEAKNLAKINHANVVKIDVFFKENNTAYFVMPYVQGKSLADSMSGNKYTEEELTSMLSALLNGLHCIHEKHILHLDIKPGNIIINEKGDPILIDFGASQIGETKDRIWSQGYAPPEQMTAGREKEIGPKADLYALGATMYHLITGEKPQENPIPLCQKYAEEFGCEYSQGFLQSIDKAMQQDPRKRWKSAAEWKNHLQDLEFNSQVGDYHWNMLNAFKSCMSRFFQIKGRACRAEFNYFALALSLLFYALYYISDFIPVSETENYLQMCRIICIFLAIPLFTVSVRRCHDINFSGRALIMLPLTILYLILTGSAKGPCPYGTAPLPPAGEEEDGDDDEADSD